MQPNLISRDRQHVWPPATRLQEPYAPLVIHRAEGEYLYTEQGPIIDAIASWWSKPLGHRHPRIVAAIQAQLDCFEHVIPAGTTHEKLVALSERLSAISGLSKAYFACDGSSAVEIALKLCLQAQAIQGHPERRQFFALEQAYHGETLGSLSLGDLGEYKAAYAGLSLDCHFLQGIPYVNDHTDPLWNDISALWPRFEAALNKQADHLAAIIVEPIVQGAAGLKLYSADLLRKIAAWAKPRGIYLIADEIMTGLGRTGKWLASEHAGISPDLVCLSKGLSGGSLPMSCTLVAESMYQVFATSQDPTQAFLHSHTFGGNALAVAAALACLETLETENWISQAQSLGQQLLANLRSIEKLCPILENSRGLGAFAAADLRTEAKPGLAKAIAREALKRGALLRPIGNTLYWLPPLNTKPETIAKLAEITLDSINTLC